MNNCNKEFVVTFFQRHKVLLRRLILFLPLLFICCAVILKLFFSGKYRWYFLREDGLIEYGTCLIYLFAFVFSLSITIGFYRSKNIIYSLMYFLLSAGFLFVGMEEISWGQRIFNMETPEYFKDHNYQNEISLHNLGSPSMLHFAYILVGFYGAFARFILGSKIRTRYKSTVDLFVPDACLFFYFFSVFALYVFYDYLSPIAVSLFGDAFAYGNSHFISGNDQEPAELLLALGFMFFVMINKYRQLKGNVFTTVPQ